MPERILDMTLIQHLDANISALRSEIKYLKIIVYIVSFIAALAIYSSITSTVASRRASDASKLATELTLQRDQKLIDDQYSACVQFNVSRAGVRTALKESLLTLAVDRNNLTEREKRLTDSYNATVDRELPYRDCSAPGIENYYRNPPGDPNGAARVTTTTGAVPTTTNP